MPSPLAILWRGLLAAVFLAAGPAVAAGGPLASSAVEVYAHRGFHLSEPENSLAALEAAHGLGIAGAEVDLRTTRDGEVVLMHDAELARASDGRGPLAARSLAELRNLRLKNGRGEPSNRRIASLEEVLAWLAGRPGFRLALDLKQADATLVARLVSGCGLAERVIFYLPSPERVDQARAVKAVDPALAVCLDPGAGWKLEVLPPAAGAVSAEYLFAAEWNFPRRGFGEAVASGARVLVYLGGIENLSARVRKALELGARGISSDRPDLVRDLLAQP